MASFGFPSFGESVLGGVDARDGEAPGWHVEDVVEEGAGGEGGEVVAAPTYTFHIPVSESRRKADNELKMQLINQMLTHEVAEEPLEQER